MAGDSGGAFTDDGGGMSSNNHGSRSCRIGGHGNTIRPAQRAMEANRSSETAPSSASECAVLQRNNDLRYEDPMEPVETVFVRRRPQICLLRSHLSSCFGSPP